MLPCHTSPAAVQLVPKGRTGARQHEEVDGASSVSTSARPTPIYPVLIPHGQCGSSSLCEDGHSTLASPVTNIGTAVHPGSVSLPDAVSGPFAKQEQCLGRFIPERDIVSGFLSTPRCFPRSGGSARSARGRLLCGLQQPPSVALHQQDCFHGCERRRRLHGGLGHFILFPSSS